MSDDEREALLRALAPAATAEDAARFRELYASIGPQALATWLTAATYRDGDDPTNVLGHRILELAPWALVMAMLADTQLAAAALETLRVPTSRLALHVAAALPAAAALAAPAAAQVEHDAPSGAEPRPLLDHIATRLLGRKLLGLEHANRARFQSADRDGLSGESFAALSTMCARVVAMIGMPLRAAILHLDIAKTASASHRASWTKAGIALEVHNEAAAEIVARKLDTRLLLPPPLLQLVVAWIGAHGLAGQHVRGEGPLLMYTPFVQRVRALLPALATLLALDPDATLELVLDGLHVLDACDTAAVREGLLDDALLAALAAVRTQLAIAVRAPDDAAALTALAGPPPTRARLADRLRALRAGRLRAGEPAAAVDAAVAELTDDEFAALAPALATCQLWYCESATSGLSAAAQLRVLAAVVGAARRAGLDLAAPWHAQLRPLVARLHGDSAAVRYRLRLVEAALASRPIAELLAGAGSLGPLGTLSAKLTRTDHPDAIVLDYVDTDESAALVTLLGLYETRSQAAFHTMLKALCDLYGLRKDELDRVANEANYLATMNAARSDKERMLDYVRPGKIVEIGPGGGVVLDLLEARYPDSEIVGVDLSREVVAALQARARGAGRRWRVVLGAAEDLPTLVGPRSPASAGSLHARPASVDTVVFCSILHEVFSYTERAAEHGQPAGRFHVEAIRDVVRAAWATLAPGGRIVIRDGVRPPPGTRRIRFLAADARPTFDLYRAQFEGRPIPFGELAGTGGDHVELSAPDAMEFLYTYNWGPASFPYEVRELYGVFEYDAYVAQLVDWVGGDAVARVVEIPAPLRSYLQSGYRDNLAGKIELTDEHDRIVALPDSNALIVVEKR